MKVKFDIDDEDLWKLLTESCDENQIFDFIIGVEEQHGTWSLAERLRDHFTETMFKKEIPIVLRKKQGNKERA